MVLYYWTPSLADYRRGYLLLVPSRGNLQLCRMNLEAHQGNRVGGSCHAFNLQWKDAERCVTHVKRFAMERDYETSWLGWEFQVAFYGQTVRAT